MDMRKGITSKETDDGLVNNGDFYSENRELNNLSTNVNELTRSFLKNMANCKGKQFIPILVTVQTATLTYTDI